MSKGMNKKDVLKFVNLNFPPFNSYEILALENDYSKIVLNYNKDGKIKLEIGIVDNSQYKLLSTNFI